MPASRAAFLVTAALTLALLAATGPAASAGPGPTDQGPSQARGALGQTRLVVETGADGITAGAAAWESADRPVPATPLGQALTDVLRTGGRPAPGRTTGASYAPPVEPAVVLAAFDAPAHPWSPGHRGVDLAASPGETVHAPTDGVVVFAGTVVSRGVITVLHPDGLRSSLEPVDAGVEVGTTVTAGTVVGTMQGTSHCDAEACLHWGVRRGETYLDPLDLLPGGGPTVLLPVP